MALCPCNCKYHRSIDIRTPRMVPLSAFYKRSFAFHSVRERFPVMIKKIMEDLMKRRDELAKEYGEPVREELKRAVDELAALKYELQSNREMTPLISDEADAAIFNDFLARRKVEDGHTSPYNTQILFAEAYMYRRLRAIFEKMEILKDFDHFKKIKEDAFENAVPIMRELAIHMEEGCECISDKNAILDLMKIALWANKYDLSINQGVEQGVHLNYARKMDPNVVSNHSESIWEAFRSNSENDNIAYVLDNAGYELFSDLCLADMLYTKGLTSHVTFHTRTIPSYVSGVTKDDVLWMVETMKKHTDPHLRCLGQRWSDYFANKSWDIEEHPFWHCPLDYTQMKEAAPDLYEKLASANLIIFKGDLAYRKLFGDINWDPNTPVDKGLRGFLPAKLCVLRTIKYGVICGITDEVADKCTKSDINWKESGNYGVIQYCDTIYVEPVQEEMVFPLDPGALAGSEGFNVATADVGDLDEEPPLVEGGGDLGQIDDSGAEVRNGDPIAQTVASIVSHSAHHEWGKQPISDSDAEKSTEPKDGELPGRDEDDDKNATDHEISTEELDEDVVTEEPIAKEHKEQLHSGRVSIASGISARASVKSHAEEVLGLRDSSSAKAEGVGTVPDTDKKDMGKQDSAKVASAYTSDDGAEIEDTVKQESEGVASSQREDTSEKVDTETLKIIQDSEGISETDRSISPDLADTEHAQEDKTGLKPIEEAEVKDKEEAKDVAALGIITKDTDDDNKDGLQDSARDSDTDKDISKVATAEEDTPDNEGVAVAIIAEYKEGQDTDDKPDSSKDAAAKEDVQEDKTDLKQKEEPKVKDKEKDKEAVAAGIIAENKEDQDTDGRPDSSKDAAAREDAQDDKTDLKQKKEAKVKDKKKDKEALAAGVITETKEDQKKDDKEDSSKDAAAKKDTQEEKTDLKQKKEAKVKDKKKDKETVAAGIIAENKEDQNKDDKQDSSKDAAAKEDAQDDKTDLKQKKEAKVKDKKKDKEAVAAGIIAENKEDQNKEDKQDSSKDATAKEDVQDDKTDLKQKKEAKVKDKKKDKEVAAAGIIAENKEDQNKDDKQDSSKDAAAKEDVQDDKTDLKQKKEVKVKDKKKDKEAVAAGIIAENKEDQKKDDKQDSSKDATAKEDGKDEKTDLKQKKEAKVKDKKKDKEAVAAVIIAENKEDQTKDDQKDSSKDEAAKEGAQDKKADSKQTKEAKVKDKKKDKEALAAGVIVVNKEDQQKDDKQDSSKDAAAKEDAQDEKTDSKQKKEAKVKDKKKDKEAVAAVSTAENKEDQSKEGKQDSSKDAAAKEDKTDLKQKKEAKVKDKKEDSSKDSAAKKDAQEDKKKEVKGKDVKKSKDEDEGKDGSQAAMDKFKKDFKKKSDQDKPHTAKEAEKIKNKPMTTDHEPEHSPSEVTIEEGPEVEADEAPE